MIQPVIIKESIKSGYGPLFRIGGAVDDPMQPSLKNHTGTHDTGLNGYINGRTRKTIIPHH
jgi:hypothetical protein